MYHLEMDRYERLTMRIALYKPVGWQKELGHKTDETKCRASVYDGRAGCHQCNRNPKEEVEGVSLCTQHAKIARGDDIIAAEQKVARDKADAVHYNAQRIFRLADHEHSKPGVRYWDFSDGIYGDYIHYSNKKWYLTGEETSPNNNDTVIIDRETVRVIFTGLLRK